MNKRTINELYGFKAIRDELEHLGENLFNQGVNKPESLDALGIKYNEKGNVLTISEDKQIVGLCAYYDNEATAFISMFVIDRGWQYQGYGTVLLREVLHRCAESHKEKVLLEVSNKNIKAIDFYRKNGFEIHKEGPETIILEIDMNGLRF